MCDCTNLIETEYGTVICRECGLERKIGLPSLDCYTTNSPLHVGYYRVSRVKNILDQLFQPQIYCYPSSEVLYHIYASKLSVADGVELLTWLRKLPLKNKKYNAAHYYYMFSNRDYKIPNPPPREVFFKILREFYTVESIYRSQHRRNTSFFSYNWLIRKLLTNNNLDYYIQFLKPIKCKHRRAQYQKMYDELIMISDTHPRGPVRVSDFHKLLCESPGDVAVSRPQRWLNFSDPAIKNLLNTLEKSP